jgi:hypothetical protein
MTLHYHGGPITPNQILYELSGCCFCVSFSSPQQVAICHDIGQSVLLDNGAFPAWTSGKPTDWPAYYSWCDKWLDYPTTWAIIPDVITGTVEEQDALLLQWPHGERGAPVWHMHEPIERLTELSQLWPRICIGSSAQYRVVMSDLWCRRMNDAWDALSRCNSRLPWVHMLRGMQCVGSVYPFASVDSTDIARNHHRPQNRAARMAKRWDSIQCPPRWIAQPKQADLFVA